MWLSPRKAKCVSQDPHWAPHPIWVLTFTRFRFTAALLVLSDVCSEHESVLAVSQTHSCSFTLAIPRAHSGCTCNAIRMPPYSHIFPQDCAADCYASKIDCSALLITYSLPYISILLFFVLQQMCLNVVLSQRVTLSVLYLKDTVAPAQDYVTSKASRWDVCTPVCHTVSSYAKTHGSLRINENHVWILYKKRVEIFTYGGKKKSIICALTCII